MSNISGNFYLVLSSDSLNSTGNATSFTQVLAESVILNNNRQYEVSLVDFECPTPNPYTNRPLHITADICVMSDVNGVLKRFIGRSMVDMPTPLEKEQFKVKSLTQEWIRLSKTTFSEVSITIEDDAGEQVPIGDGKHSSVTICIREVQ